MSTLRQCGAKLQVALVKQRDGVRQSTWRKQRRLSGIWNSPAGLAVIPRARPRQDPVVSTQAAAGHSQKEGLLQAAPDGRPPARGAEDLQLADVVPPRTLAAVAESRGLTDADDVLAKEGCDGRRATDASAAVARQPVHGVGGYRGRAPVSGRRRHGALRDHPEPSLGPQGGQRERLDAGRLARGPAPEAAAPDVGGASELHEQAAGRHGAGHAWGSAGALLALCRAGDVVQPAVPLATGLRKHEVQDVHRRTREQITGVRGAHLATDRRFIRLRRPARRHYVRAAGDALSGPEEFDFQRYGCDACLAVHRHIVQEAVHQKCPDDLHRGHHRVFTGRGATDVFVAVAQIVLAWRKGPR
mmetsp:Transcript_30699/g.102144  ORF Transcript_30699/g.102144 Transcript_30699/m.102144 type:complete len:358 (+) Transcript_30699:4595-5668(+)